jgi:Na+/H+ antiporter NhaC
VELSLFTCVFVGACIIAGNLKDGFKDTLAVYLLGALFDEDHCYVVLFTLFLSGLVGMIERAGGLLGFTKFIRKYAKSSRTGQFAVYATGCMIFFDDYANILLAGEMMQPLTDLLVISREKLAFIVDATAAPIASISPISSWVGFEVNLINDEITRLEEIYGVGNLTINTSGLAVFLQSIKYRYYPIFMIVLIFVIILVKRDFGPMLVAERLVTVHNRTDGGSGKGKASHTEDAKANQPTKETPLYAMNMMVPIAVLVCNNCSRRFSIHQFVITPISHD